MKKFILSMFIIVSFGAYVIFQSMGNTSVNLLTPTVVSSGSTKKTSNSIQKNSISNKTSGQNTTSMMSGRMMNRGLFKDGSYTGPSVDAYYGYVQVKAIISGGRLVDVQFLDYPQDRGNSIRINNYALPILKQEAIQAQSANVNAVSGASATSPAFVESLSSALNQARV